MTARSSLVRLVQAPTFAELDADVQTARRALDAAMEARALFCRQWGYARGYRVALDPDQVRRASREEG